MHLQRDISHWTEALPLLPDGAMIKAVDRADLPDIRRRGKYRELQPGAPLPQALSKALGLWQEHQPGALLWQGPSKEQEL